jgi:mono/diheme cytochrome c family protein
VCAIIVLHSCQTEAELNFARYYTNGSQVYAQHCANCHGSKGEGLGKLYPPLTDSTYLKVNKSSLACIIKYGLNDTIKVGNIIFSGNMPAETHLPDMDIAAVITYITNSFGNKQGLYTVENAGSDLKSCRQKNENKQ